LVASLSILPATGIERYTTLSTANVGALFTSDPLSLVGALFTSDPLSLVGALFTSEPLSLVGALFTSGLNNIPVYPSLLQRLCCHCIYPTG
jgi:hypothetical protein